jgi:GTP-binding protein Era
MNALLGERLAIATPKPQTTRDRILGIRTTEQAQFIFLDTPGIHRGDSPLNRSMVSAARETFRTADILLFLVEAPRIELGDREIAASLAEVSLPVILGINKIDKVARPLLLPLIDEARGLHPFREIVPLSALTGDGVPVLLGVIRDLLPEGPPLFPEDALTDRPERFIAAEIGREQIILATRQEIPYASAVTVEAFKEDEGRRLIRIHATIHVEKDSQKAILIGRKGAMLKEIGTRARREMERFFAARIFLELFVRVQKDWTRDPRALREFGYSGEED